MGRSMVAFALLTLGTAARAEQVFSALLDGSQEVPANGSQAFAYAKLTLSDDAASVRLSFAHTFADGEITGAHIHDAPIGVDGNIIIDVGGGPSPKLNFSAAVPDGQLDDLLAGEWYLNLHTSAFPGGEIRGQFAPATAEYVARLNGLEEVPANRSRAHGYAHLYPAVGGGSVGFASIRYFGLATPVSGAHIHGRGFPFTNAPVIVDLGGPTAPGIIGDAHFSFTSAQAGDLRSGLLYVNVHTTAFGGGEIRGQLIHTSGTAYATRLDGAQAVPPNGSAATGQGIVVSFDPPTSGKASLRFEGLASSNTQNGLYQGSPGVDGSLIHPIAGSGGTSGEIAGQNYNPDLPGPDDVPALLARGSAYFNVHTANLPDGEIRGQLQRFDFISVDDFE